MPITQLPIMSNYAWYGLPVPEGGRGALAVSDWDMLHLTAGPRHAARHCLQLCAPPEGLRDTPRGAPAPTAGRRCCPQAIEAAHEEMVEMLASRQRLPKPSFGAFSMGPQGVPLMGFDAQPLLLAEGADGATIVLRGDGSTCLGPKVTMAP